MMMRKGTMLASKHSITAPFFPVKSLIAFFVRRIPPVFIRAGYAFFALFWGRRKKFLLHIHCPVN